MKWISVFSGVMWQRSSKTKDAFFFPPLEKKKRGAGDLKNNLTCSLACSFYEDSRLSSLTRCWDAWSSMPWTLTPLLSELHLTDSGRGPARSAECFFRNKWWEFCRCNSKIVQHHLLAVQTERSAVRMLLLLWEHLGGGGGADAELKLT